MLMDNLPDVYDKLCLHIMKVGDAMQVSVLIVLCQRRPPDLPTVL